MESLATGQIAPSEVELGKLPSIISFRIGRSASKNSFGALVMCSGQRPEGPLVLLRGRATNIALTSFHVLSFLKVLLIARVSSGLAVIGCRVRDALSV